MAGAVSITLSDAEDTPILEPVLGATPLWDRIELLALFELCIDPAQIKTVLGERLPQEGQHAYTMEFLADDDWTRKWMTDFKPDALWSTIVDLSQLR